MHDPDAVQTLAPGRWRMWAFRDHEGFFEEPGHRRYALAHATQGQAVQPVLVSEHADGLYYGWIPTGEDVPTIVHRHRTGFSMCFTYGVAAELKAGRGRVTRLDITEA